MRKLRTFKCEICKKIFERRTAEAIVCSNRECQHEWQRREAKRIITEESYRAPELTKQPHLYGNDFLVFSDAHCPRHNADYMNHMIDTAVKEGIRKAICVGDLWDFDELSSWIRFNKGISTTESILSGSNVANALASCFDEFHITIGNHDVRLLRSLKEGRLEDPYEFMIATINKYLDNPKVKLHEHTNMFLHTCTGLWILVHPGEYRKRTAPNVEVELCSKYHAHTIGTHGHLAAMKYSICGRYLACQIGAMCEQKKIEYCQEKITTHPMWQNAFAIIKDGQLKLDIKHRAWRN